MIVKLEECTEFDTGLFLDIATHKTVTKWVENIIEKKCEFYPLDFSVMVNGKIFTLIRAGETTEALDEMVKVIKKLPSRFNQIPNDWLKVKADAFERELFIKIDVPSAR